MYRRIHTYGRILVALDGSEESYRALEHAASIAEKFGSELTLLAVVPRVMLPLFLHGSFGPVPMTATKNMAQVQDGLKAFYQNVLTDAEARVRSEHPELKMEKVLREGRPSSTIVEEAESDGVDLIVMGSRGIGGITGLILGNNSRRVIDSSTKPVLVVK